MDAGLKKLLLFAATSAVVIGAAHGVHAQSGPVVNSFVAPSGISSPGVLGLGAYSNAGPTDVRAYGKTYPASLYASTTGSDANNTCLNSGSPCTAQGAINAAGLYSAFGQNVTINLANGTYDVSLFIAGPLNVRQTGTSSRTDSAILQLAGSASGSVIIHPTVGGGGCAQNYGDGLTLSQQANVILSGLTIETDCTGRSDAFVQNGSYLTLGLDVVWGSASEALVHVEAGGYFEVPQLSPFTVAAGTNAVAAIEMSTNAIANFDGNQFNFNGNASFSTAVITGLSGSVLQWISGTTVNLNGHTVTGTQYILDNGAIFTNASSATPPGNVSGVLNSGGLFSNNAGSTEAIGTLNTSNINGGTGGVLVTTSSAGLVELQSSGGQLTVNSGGVVETSKDFTADTGNITATTGNLISTAGNLYAEAGNVYVGSNLIFGSSGNLGIFKSTVNSQFSFRSNDQTKIDTVGVPASATWEFGGLDAASPTAQTLSVQNVVTGTSNTAGALTKFVDSGGTGTGASGGFEFDTHSAGGSGSTPNAAASTFTITSGGVGVTGTATISGAINKVTITPPASGSTLTIANGKTLTASNTLTFAGTDSSTLNVGTGGTLAAPAFQTGGVTASGTTCTITAITNGVITGATCM